MKKTLEVHYTCVCTSSRRYMDTNLHLFFGGGGLSKYISVRIAKVYVDEVLPR